MLPYLVTDAPLPFGTEGKIRERKRAVDLVQWHFHELLHLIRYGNPYSGLTVFLQRHQGKYSTGLVTITSLHFLLLSHPSEMLCFCSSYWTQRELQTLNISLKSSACSVCTRSVLECWSKVKAYHCGYGDFRRRGWYCWITCQKWSEMKGEGSKGKLENIWRGKKVQSFRGADSIIGD